MKKPSYRAKKLKKAILAEYVFETAAELAILDAGLAAYDLMHDAQAQVDRDGLCVKGDRGGVKAHPCLQTIRDSRSGFLAALKALRLSGDAIVETGKGKGRPTDFELWKKRNASQ